jgi:hypothetical protein
MNTNPFLEFIKTFRVSPNTSRTKAEVLGKVEELSQGALKNSIAKLTKGLPEDSIPDQDSYKR